MKNVFVILIFLGLLLFSCKKVGETNNTNVKQECAEDIQHLYQFGICVDSLSVIEHQVKPGDNLSGIYSKLGFSGAEIDRIVSSSSGLLNPKSLRPGMAYYCLQTCDTVSEITHLVFAQSKIDYVVIALEGGNAVASTFTKPVTTKRQYAEGVVESNLWNAIAGSGTDPFLALKLADIYAWQIDFFGIQPGDAFKVVYEEAFVDDTISLNIQSIEGAIFTHNTKDYIAIPFVQDSIRTFFDENGNSTRKAFLKAPLDFFRITSKFSNSRYHPVLKRYRAHHGVDYAAPVGTPVKSIGDGVVIERGFQKNGAGNYVKVKHNSTYTTSYMHLSKFASGVNKGSHVQQGQVIGYVGSTGLSTGPHLDFRVYKNGSPINPLTMEAPPATPVKPEYEDDFMMVKKSVLAEIEMFSKSDTPSLADL